MTILFHPGLQGTCHVPSAVRGTREVARRNQTGFALGARNRLGRGGVGDELFFGEL